MISEWIINATHFISNIEHNIVKHKRHVTYMVILVYPRELNYTQADTLTKTLHKYFSTILGSIKIDGFKRNLLWECKHTKNYYAVSIIQVLFKFVKVDIHLNNGFWSDFCLFIRISMIRFLTTVMIYMSQWSIYIFNFICKIFFLALISATHSNWDLFF